MERCGQTAFPLVKNQPGVCVCIVRHLGDLVNMLAINDVETDQPPNTVVLHPSIISTGLISLRRLGFVGGAISRDQYFVCSNLIVPFSRSQDKNEQVHLDRRDREYEIAQIHEKLSFKSLQLSDNQASFSSKFSVSRVRVLKFFIYLGILILNNA